MKTSGLWKYAIISIALLVAAHDSFSQSGKYHYVLARHPNSVWALNRDIEKAIGPLMPSPSISVEYQMHCIALLDSSGMVMDVRRTEVHKGNLIYSIYASEMSPCEEALGEALKQIDPLIPAKLNGIPTTGAFYLVAHFQPGAFRAEVQSFESFYTNREKISGKLEVIAVDETQISGYFRTRAAKSIAEMAWVVVELTSPDQFGLIENTQNVEGDIDVAMEMSEIAEPGVPRDSTEGEVFDIVTTMPEFPGGWSEWSNFLFLNMKYPELCMEMGVQGTVFLQFVVTETGAIQNPKVLRGISGCKALEDEALRVLKLSPNWHPGILNGKAVKVRMNAPFKFKVE